MTGGRRSKSLFKVVESCNHVRFGQIQGSPLRGFTGGGAYTRPVPSPLEAGIPKCALGTRIWHAV